MRTETAGPVADTADPQPGRGRRRRVWPLYTAMVLLAVPLVFPTWWMVTSSLLPANEVLAYPPTLFPTDPQWENYRRAFGDYPLAEQYWNSLYIAVVVTVGTMAVASLSGYAFARLRLPGANALFLLVLVGLLIPSEVTIIPLFTMMDGLGLIDTHWPLVLVPMLGAPSVLGAFVMRQFFLALPDELEEAGRLDGLGPFGIFRKIALPLARPALSAVAIFTFMNTWNYFLEPLVYLTSKDKFTLPLALTQYTDAYGTQLWNVQLAASATTVIPVLVVFVVAQRQFVEGLAQTGLKG